MSRSATKEEKIRFTHLYDVGCVVCLKFHNVVTPPEIHHIDGQTKKNCHEKTIPLCSMHHRISGNGNKWVSRHGDGKRAFERAYGTEQELLEETNKMLLQYRSNII